MGLKKKRKVVPDNVRKRWMKGGNPKNRKTNAAFSKARGNKRKAK